MHHKLSFALMFAVAAVGCGSEGPAEPKGPVMLMRIMVQDSQPHGVRGAAMDLLDTPGSPLSTAVACDANHPCVATFHLQGYSPDVSCTAAGACTDPLAVGDAVPLTPPDTGRDGELGGTQLRLVFNKLLPPTIQPAQVLEVDDASGAAVAGSAFWDPSGAVDVSADPILIPYGPALVFKPTAPFNAHMQYSIKVNSSLVTDRSGHPMADQNGTLVTGTFVKKFVTESLTLLSKATITDVTRASVTLTPDEILQLGFNAPAAASTSCTASMGGTAVAVKVFAEGGASAASCATNATLLDIVAVDGSGAPIDWPAGTYTLSCTVDAAGGGGSLPLTGSFTVAGSALTGDPQSRTQHVVCP